MCSFGQAFYLFFQGKIDVISDAPCVLFCGLETLCILFQKYLFQATVLWELLRKRGTHQPEPYALSKQSGLISCALVVCLSGLLGENNSENSYGVFLCLVNVFISSCPHPCLFIWPMYSSSKNAFYM